MQKSDRGLGLVEFMIDLYYDRHKALDGEREDLKAYVAKKLAACPHVMISLLVRLAKSIVMTRTIGQ